MSREAMKLALEAAEVLEKLFKQAEAMNEDMAAGVNVHCQITVADLSKGLYAAPVIREALAEQPAQQEPVAVGSLEALLGRYWDLAYLEGKSGISQGDKANEVLFAIRKLAGKPSQQEPVVFYRCNGCGYAYEQVHPTSCDCMEDGGFDRVEYYTSPPAQRKPLTMQKRTSIVRANKSFHDKDEIDAYGIIDDVEAAHGIKGDAWKK